MATPKSPFDLPAFNGSVRVMAVAWSKTKVGSAPRPTVIVRDPVVVAGDPAAFPRASATARRCTSTSTMSRARRATTGSISTSTARSIAQADAMTKTDQLGRAPAHVGDDADHRRWRRHREPRSDGSPARSCRCRRHFALGVEAGAPDLYRRVRPSARRPATSETISQRSARRFHARHRIAFRSPPRRSARSTRRRCCRRWSAIPMAARSRPSAAPCRCSTPIGSPRSSIWRSIPISTAASGNRSISVMDATGFQRRVRPVEGRRATTTTLARRLRHRLPDARARTLFRGAAARASTRRSTDCATRSSTPPIPARAPANRSPMRSMCWRATAGRSSAICAISPTPSSPSSRRRWPKRRSPPLSRCSAIARAPARSSPPAIETLRGERDNGYSRPDYGSRLRDGGGRAGAARRSQSRGGRNCRRPARRDVAHRQFGAQRAHLHQHAGKQLDGARRRGVGRARDRRPVHAWMARRRPGAVYRKWRGFGLDGEAGDDRQHRRGAGAASSSPLRAIRSSPSPPRRRATNSNAASTSWTEPRSRRSSVTQNDRFVIVLKVTEAEAKYAHLLLVDRLPAGLEIDNPNLVDGGSVDAFAWLKRDFDPTHTEYRDDRFVAAFDRAENQSAFFSVAYVVRAVAPGNYVWPPATVEDMYRPERFGRTAFGAIEVIGKVNRERRWFGVAGALIFTLGLALAGGVVAISSRVSDRSTLSLARPRRSSSIATGGCCAPSPCLTGVGACRVELGEVDPRYVAMLLAYEDARFYRHDGVDWRALTRAAVQFVARGRIVSGGSTLTMQVARLIEPREERSLAAKLRQVARAWQIERQVGKRRRPRPLSRAGAVRRQSRGRSRGLARLFRQGAAPADDRRGGAAGRAAAVARGAPARTASPTRRRRRATACSSERSNARIISAEEAEAAKREIVPTRPARRSRCSPRMPPRRRSPPTRTPASSSSRSTRACRPSSKDLARQSADAPRPEALGGDRRDRQCEPAKFARGSAPPTICRANAAARSTCRGRRARRVRRSSRSSTRSPSRAGSPIPRRCCSTGRRATAPMRRKISTSAIEGTVTARRALQMSLNLPAIELLADIGPARFLARLHGAGAAIALPKDAPPGLAIGLGGLGVSLTDLARLYAGLARGGEAPPLIERLDGAPPRSGRGASPIRSPPIMSRTSCAARRRPPMR